MPRKPLTEFLNKKPAPAEGNILSRTLENIDQFGKGVGEVIQKRGERLREGFEAESRGEQTTAESVLQATGQTLGGAFDVGFEILKTGARQLSAIVPGTTEKLTEVGKDLAGGAIDKTLPIKLGLQAVQKGAEYYEGWKKENPRLARDLESVLNIVGTLAGGKAATGAVGLAEQGGRGLLRGAEDIGGGTIRLAKNTADEALEAGKNLRKNVQSLVAEKTVDPQFKTSAERLFLGGTNRLDDPLKRYDEFLTQTKSSLTDIKVDPAISKVGSNIGNAFEKVVAQRRKVGKIMGDELKKVGKIKSDIGDVRRQFKQELLDADLRFDGKDILTGKTTKLAQEDVKLVQNYARELDKLSDTPTIAEIDAFIARTQSRLEFERSAKGLTSTSPGERFIKKSLNDLREQLSPKKTGNVALTQYAKARKAYSDLSDFIEEGSTFLGKITQSGDFARDASLAKSSVQSVLNNGKKDWLIRLEELTGYQAIDESVLALQAMKDAGDFRGQSLLQLLSEGSVPTSAPGIKQKLLDFALDKGASIVAGTPEQRTRAFLSGLAKKPSIKPPLKR